MSQPEVNASASGAVVVLRARKARHVLLVEDEPLITMLATDVLERAGYRVTVAATEAEALARIEDARPDMAVVDFRLGKGTTGAGVVAALCTLGVPVAISTGYVVDTLPPELQGVPILSKPWLDRELVAAVEAMAKSIEGGQAARKQVGPPRDRDGP